MLRPQPLRVAGESLVQPDVAPLPHCHRVAEPLVSQLVGNESLAAARTVAMIGPEYRNPLRFKGDVQCIVGDDDGVTVRQRIGAEQFDEERHHLRLTSEVVIEVTPQPFGQRGIHRHRCGGQLHGLVHTDLQGDEVGRCRFGLLIVPDGLRGAPSLRHQLAVGDHPVGIVGADSYAIGSLGARVVVAGEPRRRAVGLPGDQGAVGQLFETDVTPERPDRPRCTAVVHDDRHRRSGGQLRRRPNPQFALASAEVGRALAIDQHLRHRHRVGKVEGELR